MGHGGLQLVCVSSINIIGRHVDQSAVVGGQRDELGRFDIARADTAGIVPRVTDARVIKQDVIKFLDFSDGLLDLGLPGVIHLQDIGFAQEVILKGWVTLQARVKAFGGQEPCLKAAHDFHAGQPGRFKRPDHLRPVGKPFE